MADGKNRSSENCPVNIARLLEDLSATMPLLHSHNRAGRPFNASLAVASKLGAFYGDLLQELGQTDNITLPGFRDVASSYVVMVPGAELKLSYLLAGIMVSNFVARHDRQIRCAADWEDGLFWLVMDGIRDFQLWPFLSVTFIQDIAEPKRTFGSSRFSVLEMAAVRYYPELAEPLAKGKVDLFRRRFAKWLQTEGIKKHHLFWALPAEEAAQLHPVHRQAPLTFSASGVSKAFENRWEGFRPSNTASDPRLQRGRQFVFDDYGPSYPATKVLFGSEGLRIDGVDMAAGGQDKGRLADIGLPISSCDTFFVFLRIRFEGAPADFSVSLTNRDQVIFEERLEGGQEKTVLFPLRVHRPGLRLRIRVSPANDSNRAQFLCTIRELQFWQYPC